MIKKFIVTVKIDAISIKSFPTATVEGSLSVITDCMQAAVVCFDGTFVDIYNKQSLSGCYLRPCTEYSLIGDNFVMILTDNIYSEINDEEVYSYHYN